MSGGWRGPPPPFFPSIESNALDRSKLSEVLPRLYLTNYKGAEDTAALLKLGCTHVAAVGEEFMHDESPKGLTYWRKNISDDEHQGEEMARSLRDGAKFIHKAMSKKKGCCVVHCAAGVSRSATVVLGYLVIYKKMPLLDAFGLVYKLRPCIWPNDAFFASLIALEKQIRKGKASVTLAEYVHWGDYEGPEEPAAAAAGTLQTPRPMLARGLKREDTCLELEVRELQILGAMAKGEAKAAVVLQRHWRSWKKRTQATSSFSRARAESSGYSLAEGSRSVGLTPQERKTIARRASVEAQEARASKSFTKSPQQPSSVAEVGKRGSVRGTITRGVTTRDLVTAPAALARRISSKAAGLLRGVLHPAHDPPRRVAAVRPA